MGKLTNLNPPAPITDSELPSTLTRDSEADSKYLTKTGKAADAETVDGIDSSRIVFGDDWSRTIGAGISTEAVFMQSGFLDSYSGGGAFPSGISHLNGFQTRHRNANNLWGMQAGCQHNISNEFYFRTVTGGTWQPWRRIWNDGNFIPASHAQTFTPTIKGIGTSIGTISNVDIPNNSGFEVQAATSSAAYISFHRPGIWGFHFGLDTNNQLSIGGWSLGNNTYKIFREGAVNITRTPLPTAAVGANSIVVAWNSMEPGQGTAEICNYSGLGGGDTVNFFRVPGSENSISIFHRTARIDKNGAYLQVSDQRTKSNFSEAPGLSVILKLLPRKYKHWECNGFDYTKKELKLGKSFTEKIGFLAQEVEKELPEAVVAPQLPEGLYSLDYNVLIACLVKSIQDLNSIIKEMQEQILNLKNR